MGLKKDIYYSVDYYEFELKRCLKTSECASENKIEAKRTLKTLKESKKEKD